jgi:hypothetical protein
MHMRGHAQDGRREVQDARDARFDQRVGDLLRGGGGHSDNPQARPNPRVDLADARDVLNHQIAERAPNFDEVVVEHGGDAQPMRLEVRVADQRGAEIARAHQ